MRVSETEKYINELQGRNIAPSHQRVMILKYLVENRCHPTVDQIFNALRGSIPTLSKVTVYNTLHLFMKAKMVRIIAIEENETRYDIGMHDHGHFKCSSCGSVTDFSVDIERLVPEDLHGFQIAEKNVYFNGVCPACAEGRLTVAK